MTMRPPEYEVEEHPLLSGEVVTYRRCLHANVADVVAGGEVVALLCLDCDAQLEP